jgi:hypothetical protein
MNLSNAVNNLQRLVSTQRESIYDVAFDTVRIAILQPEVGIAEMTEYYARLAADMTGLTVNSTHIDPNIKLQYNFGPEQYACLTITPEYQKLVNDKKRQILAEFKKWIDNEEEKLSAEEPVRKSAKMKFIAK